MSGLMEILEQLNSIPEGVSVGIIPTVLLPLAFLSTGISVIATFIAGLFGVKLKAEGPRKLLEVLLKPRILASALILNAVIYGGMQGFQYIKHGPMPTFVQNLKNRNTSLSLKAEKNSPQLHWQQKVSEGIFSQGVIIGEEVFVATKEGSLFVFNLDSGEVTHKIFFGKFIAPELILFKDYIYFGEGLHHSHHMGIYKFDPRQKKVIARFETKGHTESRVVATTIDGEDYLFFAAGGDGLYALNPDDMSLRWRFYKGHMDSHPLIHNNALYIGTGVPLEDLGKHRPLAIKVDLKTGKEVWAKELPLSSWFGPVFTQNQICFPLGEIHFKSSLGGFQCFSEEGARMASLFIERSVMGRQKVVDGRILFNDFKGTLYYWDLKDDKVLWEIDNSSPKYSFSSPQRISDDQYLFFNRTGEGVIFNPLNGKVLSKINFNGTESIFADPMIYENGFLVFGLEGTIKNYRKILKISSSSLGL